MAKDSQNQKNEPAPPANLSAQPENEKAKKISAGDKVIVVGGHRQKLAAAIVRLGRDGTADLELADGRAINKVPFDAEGKRPDSWHVPADN